jgi:ABC-type antimicrobial peptide transport system permease subunit
MSLLVTFIICLLVGQSLSLGLGLVVERYSTAYTGMMAFLGSYFAMFWLAWRVAVRITAPRSRLAAE